MGRYASLALIGAAVLQAAMPSVSMSACGYKRLFSGVASDFRCRPESRPPCLSVRLSFDCFCFTPESGPGAEGPFSLAVDPKEALTLLLSATGERLGSAYGIRRLQPFRHLHDCSGCFRLERLPGGTCTHWKSAALPWRTPRTDIARDDALGLPGCTVGL